MDIFIPDIYAQSIFTIDYDKLKERNFKCILFDVDNTMVPDNKGRVEHIKEGLNIEAEHSSMKPLKNKYKKIMKIYNFKDTEIAAVGDQLLTDIFGANRMGFTSILINPISNVDGVFTKINRAIENRIFKSLSKRGLFQKGEYHD